MGRRLIAPVVFFVLTLVGCDCGSPTRASRFEPAATSAPPAPPAPPAPSAEGDDPDGDGVRGDDDGCPDVAEDCDGRADHDGCVDPDDDEDGIPDACDACPLAAEFANHHQDDDGCPDIVPTPDALPFAWFDRDSVTPRSGEVLDAWAEALREVPSGRVWVVAVESGEDDSVLERRAGAAVDALVERGIARERLEPSTHGRPDVLAGTAADWAALRRLRSFPPMVALSLGVLATYGEEVPRRTCTRPEGAAIAPCPADPIIVAGRRLASGVVEVSPGLLRHACAALVKSEYPEMGESCRRISPVHPGGGPFVSASLVSVPIQDVDEPIYLAIETAEGVRYFFRLSNGRGGPVSDGQVAATSVRTEQLFGAEQEELVVEWESAWAGGEAVGADEASWGGRASATTVCSLEGEAVCRTIPRRVASDELTIRNERIHLWTRTREEVELTWLADGSLRVRAVGNAGRLAPLVGEHRWPDIPVVDVGD